MRQKLRNICEQRRVEAFVQYAIKACARLRHRGVLRRQRVCLQLRGTREMLLVDGAGKGVNVAVRLALAVVQAMATGKNNIGGGHQLCLALAQLYRSARKILQFIHAVVHNCVALQLAGEAPGHRRVIPTTHACRSEILRLPR